MKLVWLGLAGALGTLARYGIGVLCARFETTDGFPFSTLIVNVLGSFLLAIVVAWGTHHLRGAEVRLIVGTGFMGAFTTFSTLQIDFLRTWERSASQALLYMGASFGLGLAAAIAGLALGYRLG